MVSFIPWEISIHVHSLIIFVSIVKWMCLPSDEDKCLTLEPAGQQQRVRPELPAGLAEVPIVLSCPLAYVLSEFPKSEPPL